MKIGQLIKYDKNVIRNIFLFQNHAENEVGRLGLDLFLLFKKALFGVKASGLKLGVNIF